MKRSTFLKTLGLSAAASFCNIRVLAVPKFALPMSAPEPRYGLPPCFRDNKDAFDWILSHCQGFSQYGILHRKFTGHDGPVERIAIESATIGLDEEVLNLEQRVENLVAGAAWLLDESIRELASVRISECPADTKFHHDWLPKKYREDGTRIWPYLDPSYRGVMEVSREYLDAPETHGIPKPLPGDAFFAMDAEVKQSVVFDGEGHPYGWVIRILFARWKP